MDKLKILKSVVFLMTFCIALLLCFAVVKVASRNVDNPSVLDLKAAGESKIASAFAQDNRLFLTVDNKQILIVDLNKMTLTGTINLKREDDDGKKEQK